MRTPRPDPPEGVLARLADAMFMHRKKVVVGWVAILALAIAAGMTLAGDYRVDYSTPGSDSKAASDRLVQTFAGRSGESVDIVWKASDQATAPAATERIDRLLEEVGTVPGIAPGTTAADAEVSRDGRTAIARLPLDRSSGQVPDASGERIGELVTEASGDGLQVAANGQINRLDKQAGGGEIYGVVVAAVVLLLMFGGVVAAGLPLLLAAFGTAIAFMLGGILAAVIDTPDWASEVSIMIGLGVGIDYALLILTRYKTAFDEGFTRRESNVVAMATAGHSVLVAGISVVIALMGLFIMRLPYLYGVALAASLTVLVVLAATLTLLPAVLGLVGKHIDSLHIPGLGRPPKDPDRTPSARWARAIVRRPIVAVVASLIVLTVLAAPLLGIRFGFPDAGNNREAATTRQAYDMIAQGFGAGANASLIAVANTPSAAERTAVDQLRTQISRDPSVVAVAPAHYNDARDTAIVAITPSDGPSSPETKSLVERLRSGVLAKSGVDVKLGGDTATTVDQATVTAGRLPLFIAAVVVLSFLLLWRAFRAPVIALKAGVFTILSILAAYGVVAYVAEGGWAGQLIGIDSDLPVPPFIPVMMFAVTFGLAMDYEVFIVSRMKEERERLGDAHEAVIIGLARTSRVITAAALIMVSVFGAFALSTELILKLIGVGLASAILIDGILIRMVLLPAVMHLLGERAWWRRAIASYGGATVRRTFSIASIVSFARRDRALAVSIGVLMFGVSLLLGSSWLESAACAALAVPLAWRHRWPMGVLVAVTCAIVVYLMLNDPSPFFRPPLLVALYTVAAHGWRRRTLAIAAGTPFAAIALVAIYSPEGGSFGGQSLEVFSQLGLALAVGEAVRSQRAFVAATRERAERAERDRELEARRRVDEERVRIAREVHDIIAHSIATISTQASVGVHVGRQEPERAVDVLESIKRISVQALYDLRHALGALRDAADDGPTAPTPQLKDITELVQQARDSGLSVTLRMVGATATLPSALQTTSYRIVQEGLTNVMRHANGAHATVLISVDGNDMVIDVSDNGQGHPTATSRLGSRMGLVGLRERASAIGGDLHAGRQEDGGFRVHVTLPLEREPA